MGIDEKLFKWFLKFNKTKRKKYLQEKMLSSNAFSVADNEKELSYFASILWGRTIEVRPMDGKGDLDFRTLFLPKYFCLSKCKEINRNAALLRILHEYKTSNVPMNRDGVKVALEREFPQYLALLNSIQSLSESDAIWPHSSDRSATHAKPHDLAKSMTFEPQKKEIKPFQKKIMPKGRLKNVDDLKENNLGDSVFHSFEKIETIEEYKGVSRQAELEDALEQNAEALDELNLENVVRTQQQSTQLYQTDIIGGFEVGELGHNNFEQASQKYFYDEWDASRFQYKRDWCTVIETKVPLEIGDNIQGSVVNPSGLKKIKNVYKRLRTERRKQRNLYVGSNIDIDKAVSNFANSLCGKTVDERYYQSSILKERDLATFFLVDSSLSADSWVENKRVLDESLRALALFSKVFYEFHDPFAVATFYSNTRHECHLDLLKDFDDSLFELEKKLPHVKAQGYTRMGAPIRHATHLLQKRKSRKKLLIVIGDAKPTDFDRYEGSYGIADTERAVSEAGSKGILVHALTFEKSQSILLPRIFGRTRYSLLKKEEDLSLAFAKLLAQLSSKKYS